MECDVLTLRLPCPHSRAALILLLGTAFALTALPALGEEPAPKRVGDPAVAETILAKTRELKPDAYAHLLTRQNLSGIPGAYGTEAHLSTLHGAPLKVVLSAWTPKGVYAQEFYLENNEIVLVYETLSQFAGEPSTGWSNFMGYPGWERRSYLVNGSIRFTETFGEGAPVPDAAKLKATFAKLVDAFCRQNAKTSFQCSRGWPTPSTH